MEITEKNKKARQAFRKVLDNLDDDAPVREIPVNKGDPVHGEPEKVKVKLGDDDNAAEYEVHKDVADYMNRMHDMHAKLHDGYGQIEKTLNDLKGMLGAKKDDTKAANDDGKKDDGKMTMNSILAEVRALKDAADPKKLLEYTKARTKLEAHAKALLGEEKFDELKLDEASGLEIMKACVKNANPEAKLDDKSADFVTGAFDALKVPEASTVVEDKTKKKNSLGHDVHDAGKGGKTFAEKVDESKERIRQNSVAPLKIGMTKEKVAALQKDMAAAQ